MGCWYTFHRVKLGEIVGTTSTEDFGTHSHRDENVGTKYTRTFGTFYAKLNFNEGHLSNIF